ncbi:RDD family protein [Sulfuriflexus mobilis]|uniref:RDD family protein n=1 Tax=Sulfuriflexus mobilis TaxID=1811807 RepID=UPI000F82757D|nr:RDD family protein [Sulfuriflexus mobilis]
MIEQQYAGFWIRTGAAIIDTILVFFIIAPILTAIYGVDYWLDESFFKGTWDVLLNYLLPMVAVIVFWVYKSATPGKMATQLTIVDARTGGKPSTGQFIGRYLAYYVSIIPLMLGIIWVGIDKRKQGWHDKLAGTVVIRRTSPEPVKFEEPAQ